MLSASSGETVRRLGANPGLGVEAGEGFGRGGASGPTLTTPTLAERVADRLELDVVASKWPIGTSLGSEKHLVARFGVGRAVLREAARLLSERGVARRRPGPGGGLIVSAPGVTTVVDRARLLLDYRDVQARDLWEALLALEVSLVASAASQVTPADVDRLREVFADVRVKSTEVGITEDEIILRLRRTHECIASIAANPAVELFLEVLHELMLMRRKQITPRRVAWLLEQDGMLVDAICAGDAALAEVVARRRIEHLAAAEALGPAPATGWLPGSLRSTPFPDA